MTKRILPVLFIALLLMFAGCRNASPDKSNDLSDPTENVPGENRFAELLPDYGVYPEHRYKNSGT
ncbi:MAG: hypothetical protein GY751_08285 [Bacteroidetes bacterium]|nr:hypothetical protein [Bacteroidota bacterium]